MNHEQLLILEDNKDDAALIKATIRRAGLSFQMTHVTNREHFIAAIDSLVPDIILSDHRIPGFSSTEALEICRLKFPFMPFILVTGAVSDEFAAAIIKSGADDYILKNNLLRLPTAIGQAIQKKQTEKAQALLASIVNSSDDAILSQDLSGTVTSWNKGAEKLFGYDYHEMVGKNFLQLIPPANVRVEPVLMAKIKSGELVSNFHTEKRKKNGEIVPVSLTVSPIRDANGLIIGASKIARDITGWILAERQKEFETSNLTALINNTNDLMWSVDKDLNLLTSNTSFDTVMLKATGKPVAKGSGILSNRFSKDRTQRYKALYKIAMSGKTFTAVDHFETPIDFWAELSFNPIRQRNVVIGAACFSRNITERKKAEDEISKSNERFELVANATNDAVWDWDLINNTFWRNKNYCSHFGFSESTVPADSHAWSGQIHPDDKKRVLSGLRSQLKRKNRFWTDEYWFLKADNTAAYVQDKGYILYTAKGKPYRMVGAMLDVTEQKKAELKLKQTLHDKQLLAERMSTILNTLPANIALLDSKGIILEVNDSWKRFGAENGCKGTHFCVGDNYLSVAKGAFGDEKQDGEAVFRGLTAVLNNKKKEFIFEYPCHSPTTKRWFRMVATPLKDVGKTGVVVMHLDISELRRLEQERADNQLEEQKKITKALFLGQEKERHHIGRELHDNVNQLLAGTKLYLGMAGNSSAPFKELLQYPIELIDKSIEEIRSLSKEMVTPMKNANLQELAEELIQRLRDTSTITATLTYSLTNQLLSDDLKLNVYRILQEQTNNILKYAEATLVDITMEEINNTIDIRIEDNGKGFNVDTKRKGIGISNMISRIEAFNGKVTISSHTGGGCKIHVSIPV